MEIADKAFSGIPADGLSAKEPDVPKTTVNLNHLIACAVRQTGQAAGAVILRMEELPEVTANAAQLQEAFKLLLQVMLAQLPLTGRVYCGVKAVLPGPALLDEKAGNIAFGVEIHTSAPEGATGAPQELMERIEANFAKNKISFTYKKTAASGMLFLLTIHGSALAPGSH